MKNTISTPATAVELKRKNIQLEEHITNLNTKIQYLEELHHMMAHNLRGPAQNIQALIEVLKEANTGHNPNLALVTEEVVGLMENASHRLLENLDVMLESAMVGLDKKIVYDECDVSATINDLCGQLSNTILEKHAFITQHLYLSHIHCPKSYFTSILYNLLSNALKYSKTDVPTEITISTRHKLGVAVLTVKDNGIGIDLDAYGDRIFKFSQYFHEGYDSRGLGLYITRTQIESIGGRITVESTPGEGSIFTVYFPVML